MNHSFESKEQARDNGSVEMLRAIMLSNEQGDPHYPDMLQRRSLAVREVREWELSSYSHGYLAKHIPMVFDHPTYVRGLAKGSAWRQEDTPQPRASLTETGYRLDSAGWPIHPFYKELLQAGAIGGPGAWYNLGPNVAADGVLVRRDHGEPEVLLIQRGDSGDWALPGGMQDAGEDLGQTALRELEEETGIDLIDSGIESQVVYRGLVADPRATLNAWPETQATMLVLPDNVARDLVLRAADDAEDARWYSLSVLKELKLHGSHGLIIQHAIDALNESN